MDLLEEVHPEADTVVALPEVAEGATENSLNSFKKKVRIMSSQ